MSSTQRYEQLDVLRGLAALTVVFSHYLPYWARYHEPLPWVVPNWIGHDAVLLFFAISGFVIFITLEKCSTVLDFARLRFSRLYPTYWATLLFVTACTTFLFGQNVWLTGFAVNLTMFQEFLGIGNFDNVYWSLTIELAFYLNVAWLFWLGWHRKPLRVLAVWLTLSLIWALTFSVPGEQDPYRIALLFALEHSPYFTFGVVAFTARRQSWNKPRLLLLAYALIVIYFLHGLNDFLKALVILLMFAAALNGYLKFLVNRFTLWLGAISYALYLIHRNLGFALLSWFNDHGVGPWLSIAATTLLVLLLSHATTYLIERPAQRFLRRAK